MPDNLHIGDGLVFDRHMHVDGVFAHRPVLAVDRVGTVGVVAGVLLVGCSAVRIVGMVLSSVSAESPESVALPLFFEFSSCDCTLSPEFPAYSSSIGVAVGSPHADSNARLAADSAITLIAFDDSLLMFAPYDSSVLWLGLFG